MINQETEQITDEEKKIMQNNQPYSIFVENKTDKIIENINLFDIDNVLKNGIFNDKNNLIENGVEINMGSSFMGYRECLYQFLYSPFICELFFLNSKETEFYNSVNSVMIEQINDDNININSKIQCKKIGGSSLKFNTEFNVNKYLKIIIPKIHPNSKIQCLFYPKSL
jgi:hypothetical protein